MAEAGDTVELHAKSKTHPFAMKHFSVNVTNPLTEYFEPSKNKKVLFVGEGNFTFTVSFAAWRKDKSQSPNYDPWPEIVSTCYGDKDVPNFATVQVACIKNVAVNRASIKISQTDIDDLQKSVEGLTVEDKDDHQKLIGDYEKLIGEHKELIGDYEKLIGEHKELIGDHNKLLDKSVKINLLANLPKPVNRWQNNYNALKLLNYANSDDATEFSDDATEFSYDAVWFQCPWSTQIDYRFVRFLFNAAEYTKSGGLVCVGITKRYRYVSDYNLEHIFRIKTSKVTTKLSSELSKHFTFLGADTELVRDILKFGYYHTSESGTDIHEYILNDHVTLVFEKKRK